MGKQRIIAETGAGQHGVATATVCALFGFECVVYMGDEDMRRQELNVFRMRLLGAEVRGVDSGSRTLKDAINEAMRDWVTNVAHHALPAGQRAGRASVPDDGARLPSRDRARGARADSESEGRLPTAVIACVGGGSNAIGAFYEFIKDKKVQLIGVEAGGRGEALGEHAARFRGGAPGRSAGHVFLRAAGRAPGRSQPTHSVSAGLDYPVDRAGARAAARHGTRGVCFRLRRGSARGDYAAGRTEGIIPALESAHAVAEVIKRAPKMKKSEIALVNISGRGDKDVGIMRENLKLES